LCCGGFFRQRNGWRSQPSVARRRYFVFVFLRVFVIPARYNPRHF